ncbi:MAG: hypothetical protein CL917_16965 [Deltaproteobacteria bacterium]|nr:hypothetical protein [Deltaproteobacteria bacterium]
MTLKRFLVLVSAFFLIPTQWAAAGEIMVDQSWVMLPPPNSAAAGFMNIRNHSDEAVTLVGAETASAKRIEIHRSQISDGVARMERLEEVSIPAHESVVFSPKGMHLMLIDPIPLNEGETISIQLKFESGADALVKAMVQRRPPVEDAGSGHHSHH